MYPSEYIICRKSRLGKKFTEHMILITHDFVQDSWQRNDFSVFW